MKLLFGIQTFVFAYAMVGCVLASVPVRQTGMGWNSNAGRCTQVFSQPEAEDISELAHCTKLWASAHSQAPTDLQERRVAAQAFRYLRLNGDNLDRLTASRAQRRLDEPMSARSKVADPPAAPNDLYVNSTQPINPVLSDQKADDSASLPVVTPETTPSPAGLDEHKPIRSSDTQHSPPESDLRICAKRDITTKVRAKAGRLLKCHQIALRSDPDLEAIKVVLGFIITADGTIAQVTESTFSHKAMETCMQRTIEGIDFERPERPAICVVEWPFVFRTR